MKFMQHKQCLENKKLSDMPKNKTKTVKISFCLEQICDSESCTNFTKKKVPDLHKNYTNLWQIHKKNKNRIRTITTLPKTK